MIGRLYINEIGPNAAMLDFSAHPGDVLDPKNPYGHAYLETLGGLGIRYAMIGKSNASFIEGDIEGVKSKIPILHEKIGSIAEKCAELETYEVLKGDTRNDVSRTLIHLTERSLLELPNDAGISKLAATVTSPFAYATNPGNEAFYVINGEKPWWYEPEYNTGRIGDWEMRSDLIQAFLNGEN